MVVRAYIATTPPGAGGAPAASPRGPPSSPGGPPGNGERSASDELGQPQVSQDEVELGDVGDVESVAGGEPVAQRQAALGRAVHRLAVLVAHRRDRPPRRAVDEDADAAEA